MRTEVGNSSKEYRLVGFELSFLFQLGIWKPEPHTGLYRANPQLCKDGSRATSGGSVPSSWTHESVLDESPSFLLSSFKDIHKYVL
ncbi:uncharacterized protein C8R40DRAFT_1134773 [Lentinula edodes]|uniref:uncharacterized protein n=1 Tax=Lentinula edodes TaxID=5353 RepID=UPI001E8D567E|nr:uncharacterized protein C8R40DRAFT_1134773 [Lentinula edodes]KAH7868444.1 hypothetical protein C8R40DRAFT_1134773 [Lentinula edodes]